MVSYKDYGGVDRYEEARDGTWLRGGEDIDEDKALKSEQSY